MKVIFATAIQAIKQTYDRLPSRNSAQLTHLHIQFEVCVILNKLAKITKNGECE